MDARSLLRAKKAEARIEHPYASYTSRGDLRCSVCAVPVKQWDAHILTKQHRTSVAREKALAERASTKRAAAEQGGNMKRQKVGSTSTGGGGVDGLPAGFFSSENQRNINISSTANDDDEEAQEEEEPSTTSTTTSRKDPTLIQPAPTLPAKTGDADLDDFLASLAEPEPNPNPNPNPTLPGSSYTTTISGVASYEAAPILNIVDTQTEVEERDPEPEETEAERRARLAREEREEIMGRLEEEERAQEDADDRVAALKARMEMIKKRREAKAGSKPKIVKA
ncbi:hypothetical protein BCR39DRAFT_585618 [Naematelia encephala]|uniref:Zinc finger protein 830 n=1 Tax=Naematelia encephala TaxID=71784 RepID=A0A1Y2BIP1_9TREE|nr:hypothetical protein BCR39DRAFT_585618 [Naematelia encephala]